jgi:hypothetical protein
MIQALEKKAPGEFPAALVREWRKQVKEQREFMFHRNWKNTRQVPNLQSRTDAQNFQFVVEWYEEFGDVVGRTKNRARLDKLIAMGIDVNLPREEQPF